MEKAVVLPFEKGKEVWRHGARVSLVLEYELPVGEMPMVRHAQALAQAFAQHAAREYFPEAARELEALVGAGRGFAFLPHRLQFLAHATREGNGFCMTLSLCYTAGGAVRLWQEKRTFWTADGAWRCRKSPCKKKGCKIQ